MIIDFLGMPGAGKSTLAVALNSALKERRVAVTASENGGSAPLGVPPLTKWARRRFKAGSLLGNPGLVVASVSVTLSSGRLGHWPMFVNLCGRDWALRQSKPEGILLLHESSEHRLCIALALANKSCLETVKRFLTHMTWPDAVVYLRVDPELAVERVRQRLLDLEIEFGAREIAADLNSGWRNRYSQAAEQVIRTLGGQRPHLILDGASGDAPFLAARVGEWMASLATQESPYDPDREEVVGVDCTTDRDR